MLYKGLFLVLFLGCLRNSQSADIDIIDSRKSTISPTIVLCHDLGGGPDDLMEIKKKLHSTFSQAFILIPHEKDAYKKPIKKQSDDIVKLVDSLQSSAEKNPIALVGHGQGGLRAYWAAQELTKKRFPVACIVTIGTPWEGAPVLNQASSFNLYSTIQTSDASQNLKIVARLLHDFKQKINSGFEGKVSFDKVANFYPVNHRESLFGVYDINPENGLLQEINRKLKDNEIPILAIGGDASSLSTQLDQELKKFSKNFSLKTLLGSDQHDFLVPLNSQLAKGVQAKEFYRCTVKGAVHFAELLQGETQNPQLIHEVINFINKNLVIN